MTILILHGIGGHAGIHWQQWLHDELENLDQTVLMPDLPYADHPDRQTWLKTVKQAAEGINPSELIIVGHSVGVTTALDFIEQVQSPVKGLLCVSGFAIDYGLELNSYFLREKSIDFSVVRRKVGRSFVFFGDNDPFVTRGALQNLADGLDVKPVIIPDGGHLNSDAGFTKFPQLLDAINVII